MHLYFQELDDKHDQKLDMNNIINVRKLCLEHVNYDRISIDINDSTYYFNAKIINDVYDKISNLSTIEFLSIDTTVDNSIVSKILTNNNLISFSIKIKSADTNNIHNFDTYNKLLCRMNNLTQMKLIDYQSISFEPSHQIDSFFEVLNNIHILNIFSCINNNLLEAIRCSNIHEIIIETHYDVKLFIEILKIPFLEKLQIKSFNSVDVDILCITDLLRACCDSNLSIFRFIFNVSIDNIDIYNKIINFSHEINFHDLLNDNYCLTDIYIEMINFYPLFTNRNHVLLHKKHPDIRQIMKRNKHVKSEKRFVYTKPIIDSNQ